MKHHWCDWCTASGTANDVNTTTLRVVGYVSQPPPQGEITQRRIAVDHPKLDGPTVCPSNWKEGFIMKSVRNALNRRAKGEKGFTLVELLVVVIIIGILSAVAVPIYLNQRKAAWNSTIQSDVKNASLVVETAMTANNGKFDNGWAGTYSPGKAKLGTSDQEITVSKDVTIVIAKGADSNNYTITGTDGNSGTKQYTYDSANGAISESAKAAAPAKP